MSREHAKLEGFQRDWRHDDSCFSGHHQKSEAYSPRCVFDSEDGDVGTFQKLDHRSGARGNKKIGSQRLAQMSVFQLRKTHQG